MVIHGIKSVYGHIYSCQENMNLNFFKVSTDTFHEQNTSHAFISRFFSLYLKFRMVRFMVAKFFWSPYMA